MVEIFKTNVEINTDANAIVSILQRQFPDCKINFDLEDCDRILRIEGGRFNPKQITLKSSRIYLCSSRIETLSLFKLFCCYPFSTYCCCKILNN